MKMGKSTADRFKGSHPKFEVKSVVRDGITYYYLYHKGTNNLRKPVIEYTDEEVAKKVCLDINLGRKI
ncbi:hypothetical protein [Serratia plymuthica]|uniref:hypothetical protein n=1 Tax=Serratia plymuthica TaxID=82996 RepID=UPI001419EA86|nr:hypothetical protein [Serratia plymuthica]NIC26314.1 hypothetical protein [Serratia plymuthica]